MKQEGQCMHTGTLCAREYRTGKGIQVAWQSGAVTCVEPAEVTEDIWIAPGLTDLQVNGYGGVDFQDSALTLESLRKAVRALQRDGCFQFFPTLITDDWSAMIARLRRIRGFREQCPELQAAIAGWHLEGPFLSPVPGYCGAHPKEKMIRPTPGHIRELREATGNDPVLLTVAPEQEGVLEVLPLAASLGIRISLGHSNASAAQLAAAVRGGAVSFTHLGNGCPQALDRHDNILWRVIGSEALHPGLIPDSIHISPALFRILHRAMDPARFWYTTDAVHPAGAPCGRYRILGGTEVEVGPDQVVRVPGAANFAGSALRPLEGIFRAAEMLGCSWREVWDRFTLQPRHWMGMKDAAIVPGGAASFCILDFRKSGQPVVETYIQGEKRSSLPAKAWMGGAGIPDERS